MCRYSSPSPDYLSGVTELCLIGPLDLAFVEDIIRRTVSLEVFTRQYKPCDSMRSQLIFAVNQIVGVPVSQRR